MPWCWAISSNSKIAHSTTSFLGSAGCRRLFIGTLYASTRSCKAERYIHQISESFARFVGHCLFKTAHFVIRRPDRRGLQRWRRGSVYILSVWFPLWLASRGNRLRTATQERQGALCVVHELTLFMMVAVVL